MKSIIRNLIGYIVVSLIFTTLILYIYDGNFQEWEIIVQGTLLFTVISAIMERIMMLMYVKYRVPSFIRMQLAVVIGLALYSLAIGLTKPWLLEEIFNIPIFLITIFPMFVMFAVIFELYFRSMTKSYNDKLKALKKSKVED